MSKADYFYTILTKDQRVIVVMVLMSVFFGVFLWHTVLSPFASLDKLNEARETHGETTFENWDAVYEQCFN